MSAPTKPAPRAPGPCDICGEPIAPFGYAPPGPRSLKPGQRALRSCGNPDCRAAARARRSASLDPFQRAREAAAPVATLAPAQPLGKRDQGSLFD